MVKVKRRRERRDARGITSVSVACSTHDLLREAADKNRVQISSLTEYLIAIGLDRIATEGIPIAVAS